MKNEEFTFLKEKKAKMTLNKKNIGHLRVGHPML